MLLIASRRKLGHKRRDKRRTSAQTHYLAVSRHTESNSTDLVTDIGQATWLSHVKDAGAAHGMAIYVHGFNTPQKTMLARHYRMKHHVRRNGFKGVVIAFDWPNFASKWQYSADRTLALGVAPFLMSDVVAPVVQAVPAAKIHIVAHSMGALLTTEALKTRAAGLSFDQVCFVSADVDARDFAPHSTDWTAVTGACNRFTNFCSGTDKVLKVPGAFVNGMQKRLGQAGLPQAGAGDTFDVEGQHRFAEVKQRNSAQHSHTWWFEDAFFFKDLCQTLMGGSAAHVSTRLPGHPPPKQMIRARP
ncbi:alpha/beta fold hydrolase [uncultured Tateyamaria sp.]|uniref:alpha/beta fold hydrolase n=1 Tax=uncultured Tateyamaria sp. TaxID=455651 RepID=UPI0026145892|nr:alpha/beta fold hydrolase [uncultured Tateyamaria sp.]